MMSLWDALRMNMMISYQELVRTFPNERRLYTFPESLSHPWAASPAWALDSFALPARQLASIVV